MTDNERYLMLQEKYLSTGDLKAWADMWQLAIEISTRIIRHEISKKGFYLDKEDIQSKSLDAALYVMRRYKTRQNYKIEYAVTTFRFGVIHALYNQTREQIVFSNAASLEDLQDINLL